MAAILAPFTALFGVLKPKPKEEYRYIISNYGSGRYYVGKYADEVRKQAFVPLHGIKYYLDASSGQMWEHNGTEWVKMELRRKSYLIRSSPADKLVVPVGEPDPFLKELSDTWEQCDRNWRTDPNWRTSPPVPHWTYNV